MKLLAAIGVALLAMLGLSGSFASTASARCAVVVGDVGSGIYNNAACTEVGGSKEYVKVKLRGKGTGNTAVECAEVEEPNTEEGHYTDPGCILKTGQKRFFLVNRAPVTLCDVHQDPCEEANAVSSVHLQLVPETVWLLKNSIGNVSCSEVLNDATVGESGGYQPIESISLTFSGCSVEEGGPSCTVSSDASKESPNELRLERSDLNFGELRMISGEISIKCGILISCTYDVEGLLFEAQGAEEGSHGVMSIEENSLEKSSGFLCPKSAEISSESLESSEDVYLVS